MPLTFAQMALDEVEVPTVHGKVKLKIPAGTQTGTEFRLKEGCSERTWIRSRRSICSRACCCTDEINFTAKDLLREFAGQEEQDDSLFGKLKRACSKGIMEIKMELVNCEMVRN